MYQSWKRIPPKRRTRKRQYTNWNNEINPWNCFINIERDKEGAGADSEQDIINGTTFSKKAKHVKESFEVKVNIGILAQKPT